MNSVFVSIILPCYNPHKNWMTHVQNNLSAIQKNIETIELIIVNDGSELNFSADETKIFFQNISSFQLLSFNKNYGKGYALRQGVKAAKGNFIIYTDIDFPYTTESFLEIYTTLLTNNFDVVTGIKDETYYHHLPASRVKISKLFRWCVRHFLQIPLDDTQCGLKGFNKKGKEAFLQTAIHRYLFDLEFIFLAYRKKLSIQPVVVKLNSEILLTQMNFKILLQEFANFLKIFVQSIFIKI